MTPPSAPRRFPWLRELLVPAVMLVLVGFYAYSSAQLSSVALIFPGGLILVIITALLWPVAGALGRRAPVPESDDEEEGGAILDSRPWILVGLPILLFTSFEYLGALVSMISLVYASHIVLSRKSPIFGFILSVCVTVPVYMLFKYFLYVRFPVGVIGIG